MKTLWVLAVLASVAYTCGFPKILGYVLGGPYNKDYNILGSILGSPILGNYYMVSDLVPHLEFILAAKACVFESPNP